MDSLMDILLYGYRETGVPSLARQARDLMRLLDAHQREREAGLIAAVNGWERGKLPKIEVREL